MTITDGVATVLNSQSGNWSNDYNMTMTSFGIYSCSEETTINLYRNGDSDNVSLTIVTSDSWDDSIAGGFEKIEIETAGTFSLVVRRS